MITKKYSIVLILSFLIFSSCEELINEKDISDDNVQLLAPTNNTNIETGDISFNWKEIEGADEYQLQIATPNFTSAVQVVLDTTISTNSYVKLLEANQYEWRVRALNSAYETDFSVNALTVEATIVE